MNNQNITISKTNDKQKYLSLLLLADPDENMLNKYLNKSDMYILNDKQYGDICECVIMDLGNGIIEIKNIATIPHFQNMGYASYLIKYLFNILKNTYHTIIVGTSDYGVGFYKRLGFVYSHTIYGFFTDNYPEPIYENGVLCENMIYLKYNL